MSHGIETAPDEERSTAKIDDAAGQTFIHWHKSLSPFGLRRCFRLPTRPVPADAALVSQGLTKCLSQGQTTIFNGMMVVHLQIPAAPERQIAQRMAAERSQHVVKKADARLDSGFPASFNHQLEVDLRFSGLTSDVCRANGHPGQSTCLRSKGKGGLVEFSHHFKKSMKNTWFVTGTDTGVGKTAFSILWTRFLVAAAGPVIAVKPICSGGRDDAEALLAAQRNSLQIGDINPWHFPDPISPVLAAQRVGRRIRLAEVVEFLAPLREGTGDLVIEGAGGLLSPLGEDFDNRDLLTALGARAVVICPNRLGAINQARLVWESLPPSVRSSSALILNGFPSEDASTPTNREGLTHYLPGENIFFLPCQEDALRSPLPPVLADLHQWTKRREERPSK